MSTPLVSVVIPTHNRAKYTFHSIVSLLHINSSNLEVIVSDTSSSDDLGARIASLNLNSSKTYLNYFKSDQLFDITENHNFALARATGEYVCLIGDDDTITHELITAAAWAKKNEVSCLSPNIVSNYAWPDFRNKFFGMGHASRLYLPKKTIGSLIRVEAVDALSIILSNAGQGTEGLPKLYHGLVKRSVLEELRSQSGAYFHGSSPDVSITTALTYFLASRQSHFFTVNYPLTIPGASADSNTGRAAIGSHIGYLDSEKQTKRFVSSGWSVGVPRFFSTQTVWAHACLSTLSAFGASDVLLNYNFTRLIALCLNAHHQPEFRNESKNALNQVAVQTGMSISKLSRMVQFERMNLILSSFYYFARRALRPTISGGRPFVSGIQNIADTPDILQSWLDKKNLSFLKICEKIPITDLVSVIIPFNGSISLLSEALLSVEKQTYPYIETIVVNDGTNFEQEINKICKQFKKKIKIIHLKINQGVSAALNKGIIESKGKFINWLSHDDLFEPNKIEEQIKSLNGSDVKISVTNFLIWDFDKNKKKRSKLTDRDFDNLHQKVLIKDIYNFCTLLIPKKLFNNNLFNENLRYTQDYEMLFKLSKKTEFIFLNKYLFISRKHQYQGGFKQKKKWILEKNDFYIKYMKFYINLLISEKSIIQIFLILFYLHNKKLDNLSLNLDNNIDNLNKNIVKILNKLAKIVTKIF